MVMTVEVVVALWWGCCCGSDGGVGLMWWGFCCECGGVLGIMVVRWCVAVWLVCCSHTAFPISRTLNTRSFVSRPNGVALWMNLATRTIVFFPHKILQKISKHYSS